VDYRTWTNEPGLMDQIFLTLGNVLLGIVIDFCVRKPDNLIIGLVLVTRYHETNPFRMAALLAVEYLQENKD
jgi:hypothetical protein